MDNTTNNSDSDLSDDWSIVNAKESPPLVSESESIEVIEDDENYNDEEGCENKDDSNEHTDNEVDIDNKPNERLVETRTQSVSSVSELPVSRIEELEDLQTDYRSIRYCVFPEEFHNVFTNVETPMTVSDVMCSISLVILCTVASSLMVFSSDNLRPSFIDVLAWQSLPDNQKDFGISNLGLINQQLKNRNEFLENQFKHLSLAVKAFEENMISDTALAKFVTDLEKSVQRDGKLNGDTVFQTNGDVFSKFSTSRQKDNSDSSVNENKNDGSNQNSGDSFEHKREGKFSTNKISDAKQEVRRNEKPIKLLNSVLSLFNTMSEPGILLNKASLLLLNSKDKLLVFKNSMHPSSFNEKGGLKFNKLKQRIDTIEANINQELNNFFVDFSKKTYVALTRLDGNINEYICRNYKISENGKVKLNELCSEKNKLNVKDGSAMNKHRLPKENLYKKREDNSDNRVKPKINDKLLHYDNYYKTDGDAIGKSKDAKLYRYNNIGDVNSEYKNERSPAKSEEIIKDKSSSEDISISIEDDILSVKEIGHSSNSNTTDYKKDKNYKKNVDEINMEKNNHKKKRPETRSKYDSNEKNKKNNKNYKEKSGSPGDPSKRTFNLNNNVETPDYVDETDEGKHNNRQAYLNNKYDKITFKKLKKRTNHEEENHGEKLKKEQKSSKHLYNLKNSVEDKKKYPSKFVDEKIEKKNVKNKNNSKDDSKSKDKRAKTLKQNHNNRMTFEDMKRMKEDILNSIHSYIDELLIDFSNDYNPKGNNNTLHSNSKFISGDWFLTLGKKRSEIRDEKKRSDWLFNRAEGRHNLRDLSIDYPDNSLYEKTYWFFRRAWERNRIRL